MKDHDVDEDLDVSGLPKQAAYTEYPSSYEGDFLQMCTEAKDGDPSAITHLWKILYKQAVETLIGENFPYAAAQDYALELTDRYLLGFINKNNQKTEPLIKQSDKNFKGHFETILQHFVYHRKVFRPSDDVLDVNEIVYDHTLTDPDGEEDDLDPPTTHNLPGKPSSPGWIPGPEESYEMKRLLNQFLVSLPTEARNTFRLMLEDMNEAQISEARGLHIQTVKQHKRKIREAAIDFFSVTHPEIVNELLMEETEDNV